MRKLLIIGALVLVGIGVALAMYVPRLIEKDLNQPWSLHDSEYVTSDTCLSCHRDRHRTWYRTWHRTMTQEATPATVAGAFDGRDVTAWGMTIRPIQRGDRFYFEYRDPGSGELIKTVPVLRTVGSHRYQQYLTQSDETAGNYFRLHMLWHIGEQRWVHMNGAFLAPDEQHFDGNVTTWNHNCIFCHNTGPRPGILNYEEMLEAAASGLPVNSADDALYESEVAELGIACETCHGPGSEHAERNRNPLRRLILELTDRDDPTIVNPSKLSTERSTQVCGQCHGQRMPKTVAHMQQWISTGLTYRPGDDLSEHVNTIWPDTPVPGTHADRDMFRLRFWEDGTPRLSAYEYQGLLQSACYQEAGLTCIDCHTMHGGDPNGNIDAFGRGNGPCLECHQEYREDVTAHTRHAEHSAGSLCYNCHMPKIAYGVMTVHRSHRIERPVPARDANHARPNACGLCHVDKSLVWIAREITEGWGVDSGRIPGQRGDGAGIRAADGVASLLAGDPLQRSMYATAMGRESVALAPEQLGWMVPHLLMALEDKYPAVRRFARNSLLQIDARLAREGIELGFRDDLEAFDFTGKAEQRLERIINLATRWRDMDKSVFSRPPPALLLNPALGPTPAAAEMRALGQARSKQIRIGE